MSEHRSTSVLLCSEPCGDSESSESFMVPASLTPPWLSWLHVTKPRVVPWCSSHDGMCVKDSLGTWLSLTNSSGCWEHSNILGDIISPPRDSGAVLGFMDAVQCMHRGSLSPGLLSSGWSASQTHHICMLSFLHLFSWSIHGVWYTLVLRTQDSRDVAMAHCQVCKCFSPSSLVLVTGRGYLLL